MCTLTSHTHTHTHTHIHTHTHTHTGNISEFSCVPCTALHCPLSLLKFCCDCCFIFRFSPCKVSAQSYLLKWSCDLVVSWSEILEQIDSMSSSSLRVLIMYLTVCPCLGAFVNTSNQWHKLHTAHSFGWVVDRLNLSVCDCLDLYTLYLPYKYPFHITGSKFVLLSP